MNQKEEIFMFRISIRQIFSKEVTAFGDEVTKQSSRLCHCYFTLGEFNN